MTAERTTLTLDDAMKATWQALLRGDYAERDRLCEQMKRTFHAHGGDSLPGDTPLAMPKRKLTVITAPDQSQVQNASDLLELVRKPDGSFARCRP